MQPAKAPFKVRFADAADVPFIFSSWLRSYRETRAAKLVGNAQYYEGQHAVIEGILQRPNIVVEIACDEHDPSTIFGYIVHEVSKEPLVHWLYVKLPFRNFGIGQSLLQGATSTSTKLTITHLPKIEKKLFEKFPNVNYNPYLAVYQYEDSESPV